ncbi:MAG: ATP-binding protein [Selenomonas sp.]|nr:ATP-binding protein [Selenomonas sp.]
MAKIGKNVLENLTQAMYSDSRITYREYIQNSTDQIDIARKNNSFPGEELHIEIIVDPKKRNIYIEDNANGIPHNEVKKRLGDVADSEKIQGEAKGFRGIGRLGGVGYCKELRFVTSYSGEDKQTTMTWNAEKLNEIIHDSKNHDTAEQVLGDIISYAEEPCEKVRHFFRVEMLGINKEAEKLLVVDDIAQYISEVAPVDFDSTFYYAPDIQRFIDEHDEVPQMDVYPVFLREEGGELIEIKKKYPNCIYKINNGQKQRVDDITNIQADIIRDENGKAIAWLWYAISAFKGTINEVGNPMRGLRLRQFNILIGDRNTLSQCPKFFKEGRGNNYFMGEVHTLSKDLRPNARRDYFNESQSTRDFENSLQEYILNNLDGLYRDGSKINSAYNKLRDLNKLLNEIDERQKKGVASAQEERVYNKKKETAIEKAKNAVKEIKRIDNKASESPNSALSKVVHQVNKDSRKDDINFGAMEKFLFEGISDGKEQYNTNDDKTSDKSKSQDDVPNKQKNEDTLKPKSKKKRLVDELASLNRCERKLISKVYGVIQKNLMLDEANALIEKIQEEIKNNNAT